MSKLKKRVYTKTSKRAIVAQERIARLDKSPPVLKPTGNRRVMIATPSHDGRVSVRFADSIANSIKLLIPHGIDIVPIYWPGEAILPWARNNLLSMATYNESVGDVVWIDSDISWKPEDLGRILSHDVDVVGGACPKKSDEVQWNFKTKGDELRWDERGLAEIEYIGTGFLRMRRKAFMALAKASPYYEAPEGPRTMAFDFAIGLDNKVRSEDHMACVNLQALGFPTYLDVMISCAHTGSKTWDTNFFDWLKKKGSN